MSSGSTHEVYLKILMERTGADRMMMGFSMFETSRALVRAGILSRQPEISEKEMKIEMFRIFYDRDFDPATKEKIISNL